MEFPKTYFEINASAPAIAACTRVQQLGNVAFRVLNRSRRREAAMTVRRIGAVVRAGRPRARQLMA